MTPRRQTPAIVGLLFLTATATFIAAEQIITPSAIRCWWPAPYSTCSA
jgi:hypothetical protein